MGYTYYIQYEKRGARMKYCANCGTAVEEKAKFCSSCGTKLNVDTQETRKRTEDTAKSPEIKQGGSGWFDKLTRTISGFAGGSDAVRPPLKTIFGGIFEKHKTSESEEIFICGTSTTTPEIGENGKAWPRTWLWTRVLLADEYQSPGHKSGALVCQNRFSRKFPFKKQELL